MTETITYHSLVEFKETHRQLLAQRRDIDDSDETAVSTYQTAIEQFITQGVSIGTVLAKDEDRHDAQNLLDYWSNELFHQGREAPDATLDEYNPATAPKLPDTLCPYVGLDTFSGQNRSIFFGRTRLIEQMIAQLENGRFIAVTGPSGSGKSSAVLAGLIPKLQDGAIEGSDSWHYLPRLVPGSDPLRNLALLLQPPGTNTNDWVQETAYKLRENPHHLVNLVNQKDNKPAVLIIDQFEELFALCLDEEARQTFIDNLLNLIEEGDTRHTLIITMRNDYESQLMRVSTFQRYYELAQIRVRPMNAAQLHEVIEKPANQVGLNFEDGLVAELIRDFLGEPNALPLLQFTLLKLWENRDRNRVTWAAYEKLGGGRQAIANSANACYTQMAPPDRAIARQIMLATIRPGPGLEVTRQRVRRVSLYELNKSTEQLNSVLDRLIGARLIRLIQGETADDDQIELTHEALVRSWPRFIGWLEEEHVIRRRRARLIEAAEEWAQREHDPSMLWRGALLEEARDYANINELEEAFLLASREAEEKAQEEKAQAYITQLEQARALAKAERLRAEEQELRAEEQTRFAAENAAIAQRLQRITWALAAVAIIAILAGAWAAWNGQLARENALIAAENATLAATSEAEAIENAALAATHEAEAVANAHLAATREAEAIDSASLAATSESIAIEAAATAAASESLALSNADLAATREAEAVASAIEADKQFRLASSRELARAATDNLGNAPQLALLLALEAVNTTYAIDQSASAEAEDALYRTLRASQLQMTLSGHDGPVTAVAFSPDGSRMATASSDNSIKLWDAVTGQNYLTLIGHENTVNDVVFTHDGSQVISGGQNGQIMLWDAGTGNRILTRTGDNGAVNAMALSPDGTQLATANEDASMRVWDTDSWVSSYLAFGHDDEVTDVVFNHEGNQLASSGKGGRIIIWNALTGSSLNSIEPSFDELGEVVGINALTFSPDDSLIAAANNDNTVRVWERETGKLVETLAGHTATVTDVGFNPAGDVIVSGSADGTAKFWRVDSGQAIDTLTGHTGGILSLAYSPDGQQLATTGQDGVARLWHAEPEFDQLILTDHKGPVRRVTFSPDGTLAATASGDKTVRVWDAATGDSVHVFSDHNQIVNDAAISPDNAWLASASDDRDVRLWNMETGQIRLPLLIHPAAVNSVVYNKDGSQVLSSSDDGIVRLWDVATSDVVQQFDHEGVAVNRAVLSPDNMLVATAVSDGTIRIWSIDGSLVQTIVAHDLPVNDVAFDNQGLHLASASDDGTARLWDVATGQLIRSFTGHTGPVLGVNFNRDGTRLATASNDRTTKLWNVNTGQTVRTLLDHTSSVLSVAYSPDGRSLATSSADTTAVIQAIDDLSELFDRGLSRQARGLTPEECAQYLKGRSCFTAEK
ncbi:MAG: NACHT domain-containing protein [Anaerolineae bacterium]|nr:NACHT domain-containing protein [Anaerolineae bacterium]